MTIQFERLSQVSSEKIIALNTHPLVLKHMPLGDTLFDDEYCCGWITGKEQHWQQYGYGVWAIVIDGDFAGWGGLQNEADDADLALVLHPTFWGYGPLIIKKMIVNAFDTLGILSVTVHLPLSRNKLASILKYGFVEEALVDFDGIPFKRYRLTNR